MATVFTAHRAHHGLSVQRNESTTDRKARGTIVTFVSDLLEDVLQKPLQAAKFAKHDMFREHINAMSISYFALIVLLIATSVPLLGWAVKNLVNY
jgi:hypothetical protein